MHKIVFLTSKYAYNMHADGHVGPNVHFWPIFVPNMALTFDLSIPKSNQFMYMSFPFIWSNLVQVGFLFPKMLLCMDRHMPTWKA